MRHIKSIEKFFEDGVAYATAAIGGAGPVAAPTVGSVPGVPGGSGSGDIGFVLGVAEKIPSGAKGGPSDVSDLRYLKPEDGIEKVDDLKKGKKPKKKNGFKRFSQIK
jgi:hypothetical protein